MAPLAFDHLSLRESDQVSRLETAHQNRNIEFDGQACRQSAGASRSSGRCLRHGDERFLVDASRLPLHTPNQVVRLDW